MGYPADRGMVECEMVYVGEGMVVMDMGAGPVAYWADGMEDGSVYEA